MNFVARVLRMNMVAVPGNVAMCLPNRSKVTHVKDVVGWKFVEKPSKLTASYTGDLAVSEPVNMQQPQLAVQAASDVLESADEITRRVLSLEFSRAKEQTETLVQRAVQHVRRHRFDTESPEVKVAELTAKLRRYQARMVGRPDLCRRGTPLRRSVIGMAERRGRHLRRLRATDYRRFEWLLEQLNVVYRPVLPYQADTTLSIKPGIRRMVQIYCDKIRQAKLDALRREFDAQKSAFEEERRAAVEWIAAEEQALGLPSSVDVKKGVLLEPRLPRRLVVPPRRPHPDHT